MNARDSRYPICRHTKTNGLRCQSPAVAVSAFCHHHQKLHRTHPSTIGSAPALVLSTLDTHPFQDAESIQLTLSLILNGLATGRLPTKQAGKMLYALQQASSTLRKTSMQ